MKITIKILLLISPLLIITHAQSSPLPWTKITITSDSAHCKPQKAAKTIFVFTYTKNVKVDFTDNSKITADQLEIIFDSKKPVAPALTSNVSKNKAEVSRFKSIIFKKNVRFDRMNHHARADSAEFFPEKQLCKLSGNVTITQIKAQEKDVPVEIKTNVATINLVTQEVELEGDTKKPVSTVIELENISRSNKNNKN